MIVRHAVGNHVAISLPAYAVSAALSFNRTVTIGRNCADVSILAYNATVADHPADVSMLGCGLIIASTPSVNVLLFCHGAPCKAKSEDGNEQSVSWCLLLLVQKMTICDDTLLPKIACFSCCPILAALLLQDQHTLLCHCTALLHQITRACRPADLGVTHTLTQ